MTHFCLRPALQLLALAAILPMVVCGQTAQPPLLLTTPSLSQDKIAFLYADDIWTVSRQGGDAERLTSSGRERIVEDMSAISGARTSGT